MNKIEELSSEIKTLKSNLERTEEELKQLESNDIIKRYIELYRQHIKIQKDLERKSVDIAELRMQKCEHIFVCLSRGRSLNYEMRNYPIHYCVKCGLTNMYEDLPLSNLNPLQLKMLDMYDQCSRRGITIGGINKDLDFVKKIYSEIKEANPDASNIDIAALLKEELSKHKHK